LNGISSPESTESEQRGRATLCDDRVGLAVDPSIRSLPGHALYEPSRVAAFVREALRAAGLGRIDRERPLADLVPPAATVLLKPNWVLHRNETDGGEACLYTQPAFVEAGLREVLLARPGRIVIGDAPIQLCRFEELVTPAFRQRLESVAAAAGVPISFVDFRRTVMRRGSVLSQVAADRREMDRYVLFDLGADSLIEEITGLEPRFRVGDYDPALLARTHHRGRHQYLLCREAFEADVVISMPKLKTHCKVGMTGSLKNLVGLNGNKDFLPHHRVGGVGSGGDCYPGRSVAKEIAERLEDAANRRLGRPSYNIWRHLGRAAKVVARGSRGRMAAAWYGNDTCWRMVLDLNRILVYGRRDGTMADTPQRAFYSLTDAILCGQREGPLRPEPLPVGAVTFAASPVAAELVHAALLRLDPLRMALTREATRCFRWPLAAGPVEPRVVVGDRVLGTDAVAAEFGVDAEPARGWRGSIERRDRANPPLAATG
jgi:uncharacterized protein (DUF362 family)